MKNLNVKVRAAVFVSLSSGIQKSKQKFNAEQLTFMAALFALENMGFISKAFKVEGSNLTIFSSMKLTVDLTNLRTAAAQIERQVLSYAEDEEMAQGLQEEIRAWRKDLATDTFGKIAKIHKDMIPILEVFEAQGE